MPGAGLSAVEGIRSIEGVGRCITPFSFKFLCILVIQFRL